MYMGLGLLAVLQCLLSNVGITAFTGGFTRRHEQLILPFLSRSNNMLPFEIHRNIDLYSQTYDCVEDQTVSNDFQIRPLSYINYNEKEKGIVVNDETIKMMKDSASAMEGFEPAKFCPPDWFSNTHLQTIFGALFRDRCMYMYDDESFSTVMARFLFETPQSQRMPQWDERKRYETPDNDFFDVDFKYTIGQPSRGIVLLTHGLESNSNQTLPRDMRTAYLNLGFDVACVNFRGCSGEINRQPAGYHLSFTNDLYTLLPQLASTYDKIYLSGFSCGANVIVKFLGQVGTDAKTKYNIHGAAVNCLPIDLTKTTMNLNGKKFITTAVYGNDLKKKLIQKAIAQSTNYLLQNGMEANLPYAVEDIERCKTIKDLEELCVCPLHGFQDAMDYYSQSSCKDVLNNISVPLYIINAQDDPFFEGDTYPEDLPLNIQISYTQSGGHCGYILHTLPASTRDHQYPYSSWMSTEFARFVEHIEKRRHM